MKCEALIDPETRIALEGDALVAASKNPDSPRCGYELEAGDMFCPSCGASVELSRHHDDQVRCNKRASRSTFWVSVVGFFLTNILCLVLAEGNYDMMHGSLGSSIFLKFLGYVGLFAYGYYIKTSVRRLHDIDRSGWWIGPSVCLTITATVLTFVSVISESSNAAFTVFDWAATIGNLGMVAWLGFAKGTKGPNKYGPDPLAGDHEPKSLVKGTVKNDEASARNPVARRDGQKLGGGDKLRPTCDTKTEGATKPRAKSRLFWISYVILSIVLLILSSVSSYFSRRQREQANAWLGNFHPALTMSKDVNKEFNLYPSGSEQYSLTLGEADARSTQGTRYYGGADVEKDFAETVKLWRMAAEQGNPDAQNNLGYCYKHGEGVKQDKDEAVKWYRKAAAQGNAAAQNNLGYCYDNGEGVQQDKTEAVKWYRKAAEQGHADAQLNLGSCYESGDGVEQDKKEAVKWYRRAAEQGNDDAKEAVKRLDADSE